MTEIEKLVKRLAKALDEEFGKEEANSISLDLGERFVSINVTPSRTVVLVIHPTTMGSEPFVINDITELAKDYFTDNITALAEATVVIVDNNCDE